MPYSLDDIAKLYGHSKSTLKRHIKKKKFKKSAPGKFYNDADVLTLSKLLQFNFSIPTLNISGNTSLELQAHTRSFRAK